jgi:Nuclear transport factor 2 (NTF2) domain
MADFNSIGLQFVQYYYNLFQTNRSELHTLFNEQSMLSFEGEHFKGVAQIIQKFQSLGVQTIVHQILTHDVQPSSSPGGIIVFVTGNLQMDQDAPLKFTQVFHLNPTPSGSFYSHNSFFRLNLG